MNSSGRVGLLLFVPTLEVGGAERQITLLLAGLSRETFRLGLVCCNLTGHLIAEVPPDITCFDLKKASRWDFPRLVFGLHRIFEQFDPDVVLTSMEYPALVAMLARRVRHHRTRLAVRKESLPDHSRWSESLRSLKRLVDRFVDRNVDLMFVPSKGIGERIRKRRVWAPRCELVWIPNAVDTDRATRESRSSDAMALRNRVRIVAMGRLEKIKGFDLLLRAFALLPPGEAQLVIIGDGTERLNLEALAKELELLELVTFLGAQVDPFPFLLNGTIGVVPSEFEAFGNVIIEMFAAGLPVVCFDVELGPREIIRDGINGMLLKDRNESALAQALKRLIGDESLRVTLASNARADARNNYSLDRVASVYGHWLSSLGKGRIAASESARANVSL